MTFQFKPLDETLLSEPLRAVYQSLVDIAVSAFTVLGGSETKLSCQFIDNRKFNAMVKILRGHYVVGIDVTVPVIIQYALNNLFRVPDFFPELGQPRPEDMTERGFPEAIPIEFPPGIELGDFINSILGLSRPSDEKRTEIASFLSRVGSRFMIYHELAHIVLGHIDANKAINQRDTYTEFVRMDQRKKMDKDNNELRLIWEYEADIVATFMLVSDVLSDQNRAAYNNLRSKQTESTATDIDNIMLMLIPIVVIFLIQNQDSEKLVTTTHPASQVRFCAIVSEISSYLKTYYPHLVANEEDFFTKFDGVMWTVIDAWRYLQLPETNLIDDSPQTTLEAVLKLDKKRMKMCHMYLDFSVYYPLSRPGDPQ